MRGDGVDGGRSGRWIAAAGSDILAGVAQTTERSAVRSPLLAAGVMVGMSLAAAPAAAASGPVPSGAAGTSDSRMSVELHGPWVFRQATHGGKATAGTNDGWLPATVPGCVHTDLLTNHKIADPFVGTNEKDQQWIDKDDWEYRTTFLADEALLARERIELDFLGLDTYAEVFVNGASVLSADNMFRSWRVAVKPHLHAGENTLLIRFRSPITHVMPAYERLGYVLPAANDQGTPMVSMYTRKAPYHYGWDWGPRFVTSGVWRPVRLEAWDAARIDDVHALQTSLTDARATLRVTTTVVASHAGRAQLRLSLAGGGVLGEAAATAEGRPQRHRGRRRDRSPRALVAERARRGAPLHDRRRALGRRRHPRHALGARRAAHARGHPPRRQGRQELHRRGQRRAGVHEGRELHPGRQLRRPRDARALPLPRQIGRRHAHEHAARMGRRHLRGRPLLRSLRRDGDPGVAGLHVRLQHVPRRRALHRECPAGGDRERAPPAQPSEPGALGRQQRDGGRLERVGLAAEVPPRQGGPGQDLARVQARVLRGAAQGRRRRRPGPLLHAQLAQRQRRQARGQQGRLRRHALLGRLARRGAVHRLRSATRRAS